MLFLTNIGSAFFWLLGLSVLVIGSHAAFHEVFQLAYSTNGYRYIGLARIGFRATSVRIQGKRQGRIVKSKGSMSIKIKIKH